MRARLVLLLWLTSGCGEELRGGVVLPMLESPIPSRRSGATLEGDGWSLVEGVCVLDSTEPPSCPEVHLGPYLGPADRPCTENEECLWEEFCGQGYCRSVEDFAIPCVSMRVRHWTP